ALANTLGVSLERHQAQSRIEGILEVDRQIAEARTSFSLAEVLLKYTKLATGADSVLLRFADDRTLEVAENKGAEPNKSFSSTQFIITAEMTNLSGARVGTLEARRSDAVPFSRNHQVALDRLARQAAGAL